jgi:hypothetical protein
MLTARDTRRAEHYYARNDAPAFGQFAQGRRRRYHFVDDQRRQYMIAERDNAPFRNTRFKPRRHGVGREQQQQQGGGPLRCEVNRDGHVTLYVRLPDQRTRWFSRDDLGRALRLHQRENEDETVTVRLRQAVKPSEKRRTGTVVVSHLSEAYCNRLLNAPVTTGGRRQQRSIIIVEPPQLRLL